MTVRERVLALRLLEKQEEKPEYLEKLGVHITINKVGSAEPERRK